MRLPGPAGRWAVAAGAVVWIGALAGHRFGIGAAVAAGGVALSGWLFRRRGVALLLTFLCAGAISGASAAARADATRGTPIPEGPITITAVVAEDGTSGRPGVVHPDGLVVDDGVAAWHGPALGVDLQRGGEMTAGERVRITGTARAGPGTVRGDPIAGRIIASEVEHLGSARGPLFAVGNAIRGRVTSVIDGGRPSDALLTGFLIGDTSGLASLDVDALRRSGLTHYVAVSGSNVALFLAGWWLLTAPMGRGSRRRFLVGLVGLAVFVVATRWEGSVLRAATMAGLILGGSAAGIVIDGWMALGGAVTLLLLVSGNLSGDVGFQLSVAATAGILAGAGVVRARRPRWAWTALAAAIAAQIAVIPILLWHFGTVPLLSPVANLLAAPLVSAATVVGALGVVVGWPPLVAAASWIAGWVLGIARLAAGWPQLGVGPVLILGALGVASFRPKLRPALALIAAGSLAIAAVGPVLIGQVTGVTVLDVGQGDAVLIRSEGTVALIDGGPDPRVLADRLRRHRVGRIDLLVVTHGDADHVGGLEGIISHHGVGRLWVPAHAELGEMLSRLVGEVVAANIVVERIDARSPPYRLGDLLLEPLGPQRRYAGDNDGSIVLWIEGERSMLLTGDIEGVAQRDLLGHRPDVLLVPHHGSATTDERWLAETLGEVAVVSVGENRFGHPAPEIMKLLDEAGVEVLVTTEHGDVAIDL